MVFCMKMTYKVPLIPPNLRKNETIIQIADSLQHLSKIVDDIMIQIEEKIDFNSKKLENVSNRIDLVEGRISQLRNVKKAIQVFSCSKYPASDIDRRYVPIFPTNSDLPLVRHKVSDKYPLKNDEPLENLHFYHVQVSPIEQNKMEGLGEMPNDINSVDDLLLYNSGKNLYKEFKMSDSLQVTRPLVKTEQDKLNIGLAPVSIGDRNLSSQIQDQTYFYSPDLGQVPSLDIPLDLPDLPGIADNIRYKDETNVVISPSVAMSPTSLNDQGVMYEDLTDLPELIPPTPSPPSVQIPSIASQTVDVVETPLKIEETQKVEEPPEVQPLKVDIQHGNSPDARANLMEAIREAGGRKKLKTVKSDDTPKIGKSGGDLMADLHAKLAMRRKGISGTQKQEGNLDSRAALSLMSALIPPPEETNEESTDQEEEWE